MNKTFLCPFSFMRAGRTELLSASQCFARSVLMTGYENLLMVALKVRRGFRRIGTRKFIMEEDGVGIVNDSQSSFPKPGAIVRFLVIGRFEPLVEPACLFPCFSWVSRNAPEQ